MPGDPRRREFHVIDTHYGGDVSRVVLDGFRQIPGETVREKRDYLARHGDGLRRLLLHPPHGNPAMCVNLIVEASIPEAELGYVIMEAMGYPHFSGSNSICTVTALLESGRIPIAGDGEQTVALEAPAGLVEARALCAGGRVMNVAVEGDPVYVAERGLSIELPDRGRIEFDLVWSGCFYALVRAEDHGFALTAAELPTLSAFARDICVAASARLDLRHPVIGDTGPLTFVCLAGPVQKSGPGRWRGRSATYVHPDVLCSCPTGTGTAANLARLRADGMVDIGDVLETTSPTGSRMRGRLLADIELEGESGIRTEISGRAFTLADSKILVDLEDELVDTQGLWTLLEP